METYKSDYEIATSFVRKVFKQINLGIQQDRSRKKLSMFEKGIIRGMINDNVLNGINDYVMNMYPEDLKIIIDDLEVDMKKRKKQF